MNPDMPNDFGGPAPMPSIFDTLRELLDGRPERRRDPEDWRDDPVSVERAEETGKEYSLTPLGKMIAEGASK